MFNTFKPLGNKLLVQKKSKDNKTESGLYLPDSAVQDSVVCGTVLAVGPGLLSSDGCSKVPMNVQVGDTVCFSKYSGTEADANYLIIREDEILGILNTL